MRFGAGLVAAGSFSLCVVVFAAPLLVGSVHRPAVLLVTGFVGLATALTVIGELARRRVLRMTPAVLLPLTLLAIPLLQIAPLPTGLMKRLDPAGDALLADSPIASARIRPLTLDVPETQSVAGKAAAALAVFAVAFHLSSGRSRRQLLIRVVGASGVAALIIGLGHRILGESQIYGHFAASRGLLNGPFINSNHTGEFLELGAFVCVACALAGASALNRVGWLTAALMAGAGALGTLSRGAVLGLAAGTIVFVWLRYAATEQQDPERRPGRTMLWVTLMLILLGAAVIGLGADQVVTRFRGTHVAQETRFGLWRNSLQVLFAHPFGIGRGAFERVFPAYRTVEGAIAVRFSFIENEPLQYLVEMGWFGFLGVLAALIVVVREWFRVRRSDHVEAALVGALVAVVVHNFFDFGLETLGIQIPFAVVMGVLLGRARNIGVRTVSSSRSVGVYAFCLVAIVFGMGSLARASAREFDSMLMTSQPAAKRREIALNAQAAHPVDYFYVLAEALAEPISADAQGRSPRLHALNHALLLCPRCPEVHTAVAGTLWALGKRRQALDEWHAAVETRPVLFGSLLPQVWASGARPEEIAVFTGTNARWLVAAASFLVSKGQPDAARRLLPLATNAGSPSEEILLITAGLEMGAGATDQALKILTSARTLAPQDARVFLLLGQTYARAGRIDEALQALDAGIGINPHDLSLLRSRLEIIMRQQKWHLAKNALGALETELAEAQLSTAEVHLAAGRYFAGLRDYGKANAEYKLVLTQDPGNAAVWGEVGALWEAAGRVATSLDAYREANRATPGNPGFVAAIERLEGRIRTVRLGSPGLP